MYQRIVFYLFLLIGVTVNAQTINVRGKVSNKAGQPVSEVIVELLRQDIKDTTGTDGNYAIVSNNIVVLPVSAPQTEKIALNRGVLEFSLRNPSSVKIEIFNVTGKLLKKELLGNALAGVYRFTIAEFSCAANLLVIRASIGRRSMTFRYLPLHNGKYAVNSSVESCTPVSSGVAKVAAAVIDTLKATLSGYKVKAVTISSYDTVVNITLDTSGTGSEGCGKTPPESGVPATIDVEGTTRDYILVLPDDYDPDKPYKLIFVPHPLGGSMQGTVSGGFHGLERVANGEAIFVAPDGIDDGWANTGGRDIKFFTAMLDRFNSTLCIDQDRIFSTGFSYGGMMSFAVGCAMWDKFRAIGPCSGSFYSGCDESNPGPIAVWQAHGVSDNVVPLSDGITARDYFLEMNECSDQTVPVEPSEGNCVEYQGCKDGYPFIYCEFDGGHTPTSWQAAAIWEFFCQF